MVTSAMSNSFVVEEISDKWRQIAGNLGVKRDVINLITRKIDRDNWTAVDIMDHLLINWRSFASTNATLDVLLKILIKRGLNDIVDEILKAFNLSIYWITIPGTTQQQPVFLASNLSGPLPSHVPLMPAQYEPFQQVSQQSALGYTNAATGIPNTTLAGKVPHVYDRPNLEVEQSLPPTVVDSSTSVDESNVDGGVISKITALLPSLSIITPDNLETRILQTPLNTVVSVKVEKQAEVFYSFICTTV